MRNEELIISGIYSRYCFIFILICTLLLCGCSRRADWVKFRGDGGRGVSSARVSPPLGIRWKIKLQDENREIGAFNPPVVIGNTIYFGSEDGNFYALDAESGYMRWIFKSGAGINSIPYADSDRVYVGSKDGKLYALSRQDGHEVWHYRTRSQINSQVERYKDYIIFVGDSDAIYFLSPDGSERFRIENPGWEHFTFNMYDDVMYMATAPTTNQLAPYDINKRDFLWYHDVNYSWYSFPAVRKNLLYFGTADFWGNMELVYHAYDRRTGKLVWEQHREGVFDPFWDEGDILRYFIKDVEMLDFMAPVVWKNLVIFTGGDTTARAFDAETGAPRWECAFETPIISAASLAGDRVYFGLLGDDYHPSKLVCLAARDGKFLWSMETEGALLSAPVIANKRIIFGTDKSVFYVLESVF